jgi:hypothetical protein
MNNLTQDNNDGFNGASAHAKLVRGMLLVWNDAKHWRDRDGLEPPEQLLVTGSTPPCRSGGTASPR